MYEMAKKENTQSCFQRGLISLLILALLGLCITVPLLRHINKQ